MRRNDGRIHPKQLSILFIHGYKKLFIFLSFNIHLKKEKKKKKYCARTNYRHFRKSYHKYRKGTDATFDINVSFACISNNTFYARSLLLLFSIGRN